MRTRWSASVLAAGAALLLIPDAAQAGTMLVNSGPPLPGLPPTGLLTYDAAPGELNRVEVSGAGDRFSVIDAGAEISVADSAADLCKPVSANQVSCGVPRILARLGDGDDTGVAHGSLDVSLVGGAGNDVLSDDVALRAPSSSFTPVSLVGEAGDDRLKGGPENTWIIGGTGDDVATGGAGDDSIEAQSDDDKVDGGPGDDSIEGERGDDVLRGGAGNDILDGAAGRDDIGGGPGRDLVSYELGGRSRPVSVTLDGRANDGPIGRAPELVRADIEDVSVGGPARGSNRLVGNDRANRLGLGGPGSVDGRGGDDTIGVAGGRALGGLGDDTIGGSGSVFGGPGNDTMAPEGGVFHGGPGADRFTKPKALGGPLASVRLYGEADNDTFNTRDIVCSTCAGRWSQHLPPLAVGDSFVTGPVGVPDRVFCGAGVDRATLGGRDVADRTCERVTRKP